MRQTRYACSIATPGERTAFTLVRMNVIGENEPRYGAPVNREPGGPKKGHF